MAIPQTGVAQGAGPGTGIILRESKELAQVIVQGCAKYYEATSRATVFSGTSTTGRAPGTALGATPEEAADIFMAQDRSISRTAHTFVGRPAWYVSLSAVGSAIVSTPLGVVSAPAASMGTLM